MGDVADYEAIRPAFDDQDAVIHFAAQSDTGADFEGIVDPNIIGTYNVLKANLFDAWVMLGAGPVGYGLRLKECPLPPMVLGLILAPIAEDNLRRSLTVSGGLLDIFYTSSIALLIFILNMITIILPVARAVYPAMTDS